MMSQFQFQPYYPHLEKFLEWPRILYLQPFSTRSEPFTEWPRQPYAFVTDDFCHEKPFTARVTAKTARSIIKIKESVSQKKSGLQLADQVKLWFDLPNAGSLFAKVKSSDYIKVHYDHGIRYYRGNFFYVFGGVNSNKLLNKVDLRFGLGHVSQNCNSENRLKVTLQKQKNQYHWYHKTYLAWRRFRMGYLAVVDLNKTVFQKNNLLFGWYFRPDTCGFLRAQVKDWREHNADLRKLDTVFDTVTADLIHRFTVKSKGALEATFNIRDKSLEEAKVVYQFEYDPRKIIKASLNNKLDFAVLTKIPLYGLQDIATLSAGFCASKIGSKQTTFKTGFEVSVNL